MIKTESNGSAAKEIPAITWRPLWNNVALHFFPVSVSKGGLHIPDYLQGQAHHGKEVETNRCLVLAAGPDCEVLRPGDEVLVLNPMPGIIHKGVGVAIIGEKEISAVVIDPCEEVLEWRKKMNKEKWDDCEKLEKILRSDKD